MIELFSLLFVRILLNGRRFFFYQIVQSVCGEQRKLYEIFVKALIWILIFPYDFIQICMKVKIICLRSILDIAILFYLHRSSNKLEIFFEWILIA